jgi:uncharacterized protein YqeY
MSILHTMRADLDTARKDKNKLLLDKLKTVYSDAAMVGKTKRNGESTDEEVLSVVRKFKEGVIEIEKYKGETDESIFEKTLYDTYLPQLLTTDQLTCLIQDIIGNLPERTPKQMGIVMGKLKAEFLGKYDGAIASQLTKQLLA